MGRRDGYPSEPPSSGPFGPPSPRGEKENETLAIMIILVPILIPVLNAYQVDLVHFGIVLLVNLVIGQLTPPVGVLLFVASSVGKVRLGLVVREVMPYLLVLTLTLGILTYVPALTLWLPQALK